MESRSFFLDDSGHLRSGWRLAFFVGAFFVCVKLLQAVVFLAGPAISKKSAVELLSGTAGFVIGAAILFASATLVGWACGAIFEELPFRAIGWSFHSGWLRNFAVGTAIGAASLLLAGIFAAVTRGLSFGIDPMAATSIEKTLTISAMVFVLAAAAEEVVFRGYPLQTLTRAKLAWLGVLLTAVPFAAVHLNNPNSASGFTFVNTALAGIWLAIAYLRTGSLWFPLGIHWAWNWMQAAILGVPVSGINRLTPAPLLHAANQGPDWLTGGAYGLEGGLACTVALLVSMLVVWRTKLIVSADVTPSSTSSPPAN